jgi:hypothetical protein
MSRPDLIPWRHWRWLAPVDVLTAALVIAVCIGILAAAMGTVIDKTQMSAMFGAVQPARIAASEALALSGDPDAPIPDWATPGTAGAPFQVDHLGAAVRVSGHHASSHLPYTVVMRLAVNTTAPAGSVFWVCGAHAPPPGWSAGATGPIDTQDAPNWLAPCRATVGS